MAGASTRSGGPGWGEGWHRGGVQGNRREPFCILIVMMVTQLSDLSNMEETNTKEGEFYCV